MPNKSLGFRALGPLSQLIVRLALAGPATAQAPAGEIRGRITSAAKPAPVFSGATVILEGTSFRATADSAGRFVLPNVPAGSYTLVADVAGAASDRRTVTVEPGRTTEVEIVLAQRAAQLPELVVSAARPLHVIGHLPALRDNVIYAGKKTEVLVLDSLNANLAQDVERQILGRIPGAHFSETAGAGFPSNGVGFRGLNPTQSVEMNTRQNGVNIAADPYGYPETYYTPPAEALDRIEVVRGAGSLAYGPQFGGMINYVVKDGAPHTTPAFTAGLTAGSYGLVNSFNSVSGGAGRWTYYGFAHYRSEDGWRPNSDFRQITGYGSATWHASERLTVGLDYTLFRNRIHMAGGLSDQQFAENPRQSFRSRNWLASPWSIAAVRVRYRPAPTVSLETLLSWNASDRHLVWRNEDGGPAAADSVDPATGAFVPREVERETFHDWMVESRLRADHSLLGRPSTLAAGLRAGYDRMRRFEGGPGSTGSDFDMALYGGTWERSLRLGTTNLAAFAEELVRITDRLSVTPGARFEYVRSTASGYTDVASSFAPRSAAYPLVGIGAEYVTTGSTAIYANLSGAYRPILYAELTPFGSITRVDPSLHAARGTNADLGWRGTLGRVLKLDVGAFYLWYGDRVGIRTVEEAGGETFTETTNIGNSVHRGVEAYVEFDPFSLTGAPAGLGALDLFTSLAFVDARYTSGRFEGNRVEQAPRVLDRTGVTWALGPFAATVQVSYTSASFGDANNSPAATADAEAGPVPAYSVLDWSGRLALGRSATLTLGVNNLTDARYFTKRTGEYPGPGILPGIGRSVVAGLGVRF